MKKVRLKKREFDYDAESFVYNHLFEWRLLADSRTERQKEPASEETNWEKWRFNIGGLRLIERQREVPQYEQQ